jgi:hypothetical protein
VFENAMHRRLVQSLSWEMLSHIQAQVDSRSYRTIARMSEDELALESFIKHMFILGCASAIYEIKFQLSLRGMPDDNSYIRLWVIAYRRLLQQFIGSGHFSISREMAAFKKQIIDYYFILSKVDYEMDHSDRERVALQYFYSKVSGRRVFFAREYRRQEPDILQYMDSVMQSARGKLSSTIADNMQSALCYSC